MITQTFEFIYHILSFQMG